MRIVRTIAWRCAKPSHHPVPPWSQSASAGARNSRATTEGAPGTCSSNPLNLLDPGCMQCGVSDFLRLFPVANAMRTPTEAGAAALLRPPPQTTQL